MFPGMAKAYQSVAVYRCFTLGFIVGWKGKHSSYIRTLVNYGRKKFYNIGPGHRNNSRKRKEGSNLQKRLGFSVIKLFYSLIY
jgi:hypothetical protein